MSRAYLLAYLDTATLKVTRVGIYSSRSLTQDLQREAILEVTTAPEDITDYGEARLHLLRLLLREPWCILYKWCVPLLSGHDRHQYDEVRRGEKQR